MNPKDWDENIANANWDDRWRHIVDPLCDTFQRWKAGELDHRGVDWAIGAAYRDKCPINNLFTHWPDRAVAVI